MIDEPLPSFAKKMCSSVQDDGVEETTPGRRELLQAIGGCGGALMDIGARDTGKEIGQIHTATTLIVTPANLFHQWLSEFRKFLGDDCAGLRLLPVEDMQQLRNITVNDVRKADVVIVAASFFLAEDYKTHFDGIVGAKPNWPPAARYAALRDYTRKYHQQRPLAASKKRMLGDGVVGTTAPVIFEMFRWERVIFDEFHKCVGDSERHSASWRALHEIHALNRWGLTGTPDLTLPLRVSEMAALLHVFVSPDNRVEAQRFLDLWLRADEWDTSVIPVTTHFIAVQQSPVERALYIAQRQWLEGKHDADEKLLPFCSHFAPEALNNKGTASAAVEELLAKQRRERAVQEEDIAELEVRLDTSRSDDPRILRARLATEREVLKRMTGTISFLTQTIEYVTKLNGGEDHECAICLEDCPPDAVSVTRCGHVFCTACISGHLALGANVPLGAEKKCPTCNQNLGPQDYDPIARLARGGCEDVVDCARYGSKIGTIITELRRIHNEDAEARVLVFVQWNELLLKLRMR